MINFNLRWSNQDIADNLTELAQLTASGDMLRTAEVKMGEMAEGFAQAYTPWITGSWASSWAVMIQGDTTFLGIAPNAINPYSDENPPEYGPKVHNMGGISWSGHRRDVLNVLVEDFSEEITAAGGEYVIGSIKAVLS